MRPVIIDINDISECKELYDSKPHLIYKILIVLILIIFVASIIWMSFSNIEIYIKGEGTIRTVNNVLVVTNTIEGTVMTCFVNEGDNVKKGDKLYEINHSELDDQLNESELKYERCAQRLEMIEVYLKWLTDGIDTFYDHIDNVYYHEFTFKKSYVEVNVNTEQIKYNEIIAMYEEREKYEAMQEEIRNMIKMISKNIENSIVTAPVDGSVSFYNDIVAGNMLYAETEVMEIIPDYDSPYIIEIYVSSQEIGNISEGMPVKCEVSSYPADEYGYIQGTVLSISEDIKISKYDGSAYYLVKAGIDDISLYEWYSTDVKLKVGMACNVKIISSEKRILSFCLEKLDLIN